MGYFDDPKHRAQWEKELSVLREEKARLRAGGQPAPERTEPAAHMEAEKIFEERAAEQDIEPAYQEEVYAPEQTSEPVYEEATFTEEPVRKPAPQRKEPEKPAAQRVRPDGIYRERITFQELLRQENMEPHVKLTQRPHVAERTKEAAHEL